MYVCLRHPSRTEVQVFVDAMPYLLVELAAGDWVDRRAGFDSDVGNDEAFMVEWGVVVDRLGKHTVTVIEEEHEEEHDEDENTKLEACPYLTNGQ